ncbi:ankyrin repeat domain-containing protein [Anaerovibrio sp.]|uniref:ankyrin repeat domain-containing protein n=1 Tax=Anaerovibrio sp. TaxID=1872532 RepID=UPI00388FFBA5
MKKGIRNLCVAATASALLFSATPSVEAGINWGNIAGSVIGAIAGSGNNSSGGNSSGGNILSGLSNQSHAHPNPTNNEKAFLLAITKNDISTAQALLDSGIDINGVYLFYDGFLEGEANYTPLAVAIKYNKRDMMQFLLEHGADVNGFYNLKGNYVNHFVYAAHYGEQELLEYLHNWGADINGRHSDSKENALDNMYNTKYGSNLRINCAKYLLENGINPDNVPKSGKPIFTRAVEYKDYEMIDLLYSYGADITIKDYKGRSAVDIALNNRDLQLYKYLQELLAKGQQPSKYRAVKEAVQAEAKAKKTRNEELAAFGKNLNKAVLSYNDSIKAFNDNAEKMHKYPVKDRVNKANKMLANINHALQIIDDNKISLSHCTTEEQAIFNELKQTTKDAFLKEKEFIEIFTSENELSPDDILKAGELSEEATELCRVANEKKKAAEEYLKTKL